MENNSKSSALVAYEQDERDLFQRLVEGEIDTMEYQVEIIEVLRRHLGGFTAEELLATQRAIHVRQAALYDELAKRGFPQPGNDPNRPS